MEGLPSRRPACRRVKNTDPAGRSVRGRAALGRSNRGRWFSPDTDRKRTTNEEGKRRAEGRRLACPPGWSIAYSWHKGAYAIAPGRTRAVRGLRRVSVCLQLAATPLALARRDLWRARKGIREPGRLDVSRNAYYSGKEDTHTRSASEGGGPYKPDAPAKDRRPPSLARQACETFFLAGVIPRLADAAPPRKILLQLCSVY